MTKELNAAAVTFRTQASSWRKILQQTKWIEQPLLNEPRSAKQLAAQAYDNIELAYTQAKRLIKGKSPNSARRYIELDEGLSTSLGSPASTLAYDIADISGKLADELERSNTASHTVAISKALSLVLSDNESRILLINQSFKAFEKLEKG